MPPSSTISQIFNSLSSVINSAVRAIFVFICTVLILGFLLLDTLPVASSTEAREIHVAKLMAEGESFVLPLRNGIVPSKPPLFHWIAAAVGWLEGGVTPGSVRRVSLFAGLALAVVLGASLLPSFKRKREDATASLLAVGLLVSTPMYIRLMLDARVDMLFSLFIFCAWLAARDCRRVSPVVFWLAMSCAILVKGPLGLALVLLLCGSSNLWLGSFPQYLRFLLTPQRGQFFLGMPLAWYLAATIIAGDEFLWRVGFENVSRFFTEDPQRSLSPLIYLEAYFLKLAPLSFFATFFFLRDFRKFSVKRVRTLRQAEGLCFFVGMLFFACSEGKREAYLLPLIPLLAQYVATSLARVPLRSWDLEKILPAFLFRLVAKPKRVWLLLSSGTVLILCSFVVVSVIPGPWSVLGLYSRTHFYVLLVCSVAIALASYALGFFSRRGSTLGIALMTYGLFLVFGYGFGLGTKGALKNFESIAGQINSHFSADQKVILLKQPLEEYFDPLQLLLNRNVTIQTPESNPGCDGWYITRRPYLSLITPDRLEVVQEYQLVADTLRSRSERDIILLRCPESGVEP